MLDTTKIRLTKASIKRADNFSPEYKQREYEDLSETERYPRNRTLYLKKFISKQNILPDEYEPRIEIYEKVDYEKKNVYQTFSIEFSVPKLIFENNLEELSSSDYEEVMVRLADKLSRMGIQTKAEFLRKAQVTKVHFGKNILLPNEFSVKDVIDTLMTTEMGKSYDVTKIKMKNTDEIFHFFTNTRDYVFYDKIRDILNRKGQSADKNKTTYEKELVEMCDLEHKEVLRYEYRLNKYQTLRAELNRYLKRPFDTEVVFRDLFNEDLWKEVLIKSWSKILSRSENQLSLRFASECPENLVRALFTKASQEGDGAHSQNLAFSSIGLGYLVNQFAAKFIKKECELQWSKRTCGERLQKKIKTASKFIEELKFPDSINYIDMQMKDFRRISRETLEELV